MTILPIATFTTFAGRDALPRASRRNSSTAFGVLGLFLSPMSCGLTRHSLGRVQANPSRPPVRGTFNWSGIRCRWVSPFSAHVRVKAQHLPR